MLKNTKKGFTLIELLVVIAIIGILSSVVLASLNTARAKGSDSAIKADLNGARAQAELFYDSNSSSYGAFAESDCATSPAGVINDTNVKAAIVHAVAQGGNGSSCAVSPAAYAIAVGLKTSTSATPLSWCIDNTGVSKSSSNLVSVAVDGTNFKCI